MSISHQVVVQRTHSEINLWMQEDDNKSTSNMTQLIEQSYYRPYYYYIVINMGCDNVMYNVGFPSSGRPAMTYWN